MEQNSKDAKHLTKVKDSARFEACNGYEHDFQLAYAEVIGSMMQAVISKIHHYAVAPITPNNISEPVVELTPPPPAHL